MIALAGRADGAERKRRGLERGAEPAPCEAGVALARAPGMEVIGAHCGREAGVGRHPRVAQEGGWRVLLVGEMQSNDRAGHHGQPCNSNAF